MTACPPLIAHVIYRLDVGGMENGLVNLINRMPEDRFRHAIVCLTDYTAFAQRIHRKDVRLVALHKRAGKDIGLYARLHHALRALRPDIVHTRNMAALEGQFVAAACGVRGRVHGEHGREGIDLHGRNRSYNFLRKLAKPFVHRYIALSQELRRWLVDEVGVPPQRVSLICNGVDTARYHPANGPAEDWAPPGFLVGGEFVIGAVGRMAEVKDFATLIRAVAMMVERHPEQRSQTRLVLVGDGPTRPDCLKLVERLGMQDIAWLPGERGDVPELLRSFDLLALSSVSEGISNTILEAMASGLPVVATRVGGNPELVEDGVTGRLVPARDPAAMAQALLEYVSDPSMRARHGAAARERAETTFSMDAMVRGYLGVYDEVLASRPG